MFLMIIVCSRYIYNKTFLRYLTEQDSNFWKDMFVLIKNPSKSNKDPIRPDSHEQFVLYQCAELSVPEPL